VLWILLNFSLLVGGVAILSYSSVTKQQNAAVYILVSDLGSAGIVLGAAMIALSAFGTLSAFFSRAWLLILFTFLDLIVLIPLVTLAALAIRLENTWIPNVQDYTYVYTWMQQGWTDAVKSRPGDICQYQFARQCSGFSLPCENALSLVINGQTLIVDECVDNCDSTKLFTARTCYQSFTGDLMSFCRSFAAVALVFVLIMLFGFVSAILFSCCPGRLNKKKADTDVQRIEFPDEDYHKSMYPKQVVATPPSVVIDTAPTIYGKPPTPVPYSKAAGGVYPEVAGDRSLSAEESGTTSSENREKTS